MEHVVAVYFNQGKGKFGNPTEYPAGTNLVRLQWDIAVVNFEAGSSILLNRCW